MYRVEDKYVLPSSDLFRLEQRIAAILPRDQNGGANPGYKISSVYFDDIFDTCYRDTVDGNAHRNKYRIRIYNDSKSIIKLEVKTKEYNRISKIASGISEDELELLLRGEPIPANNTAWDARNAFNLAIRTRRLAPKIIVTYDRNAYVSIPGNVRITFDYDVRGSKRIDLFGTENLIYDYPEDANSLLEVKYDTFLPAYIAQLLELGTMEQTSNSKYCICRDIYESKRNR